MSIGDVHRQIDSSCLSEQLLTRKTERAIAVSTNTSENVRKIRHRRDSQRRVQRPMFLFYLMMMMMMMSQSQPNNWIALPEQMSLNNLSEQLLTRKTERAIAVSTNTSENVRKIRHRRDSQRRTATDVFVLFDDDDDESVSTE